MRQLMAEAHVNDIISSSSEVMRGLELLDNCPSVGSLSDTNELPTDEMYQFLMNLRNILKLPIIGCEEFSGSFLHLKTENICLEEPIYNLHVKYYKNTYVDSIFR